jgi:hypothetical protein
VLCRIVPGRAESHLRSGSNLMRFLPLISVQFWFSTFRQCVFGANGEKINTCTMQYYTWHHNAPLLSIKIFVLAEAAVNLFEKAEKGSWRFLCTKHYSPSSGRWHFLTCASFFNITFLIIDASCSVYCKRRGVERRFWFEGNYNYAPTLEVVLKSSCTLLYRSYG